MFAFYFFICLSFVVWLGGVSCRELKDGVSVGLIDEVTADASFIPVNLAIKFLSLRFTKYSLLDYD
jgi:hypothetical protein